MARLRNGGELRQHRAHPFVAIPNSTIRDMRLSLRARGLLALLLSQADDWVFSMEWLSQQTETGMDEDGHRLPGEGREAIAAALRELRKHGYYRVERRHMLRDGTFRSGGYVRDEPSPEWATEYAAACAAGQTKSPRWDCTVRVLPDGTVEEEPRRPSDTPPTSTDSDDLDAESQTVPDPRKPATGPIPGNPETGSPGDREAGDHKKTIPEDHQEEGDDLGGGSHPSSARDRETPPADPPTESAAAAPPAPRPLPAEEDPEPPATCGMGHPPAQPCRDCRDARRAHEEWEERQIARRRAIEDTERRRERALRRLAADEIDSCRLCDGEGTAGVGERTLACRHDAVANEAAARKAPRAGRPWREWAAEAAAG